MANAARRAAVRRQEKEAQQSEAIRRTVIVTLMSNHDGRQYIEEQLEQAHVFQTSYSDSHAQMSFNEGERNFGLRLLNDVMQYCPEQFIQMMREKSARDELNAQLDRIDAAGDDTPDGDPADNDGDIYDEFGGTR